MARPSLIPSLLSADANCHLAGSRRAQACLDVIAREAFGIDDACAPVDDSHQIVAVGQMAGCLLGGLVANRVEEDGDFADAFRHVAFDTKKLELVALPFEALAVGCLNAQATHVLNRPVRPVRSGHPLRVPELELARLAGNLDS